MSDNETEIPEYNDVLRMLSVRAREGNISALICLERALRPATMERELDDELDKILNDED